jgi:acetyl-CoA carboxylase carboxyltransferase component
MDFIFMVKGISYAFITGPRVVKAIMGQEISEEELGGANVAQKKAGVVCRSENDEAECLQSIRELLSYLPSSNRESPMRIDVGDSPNRADAELFDIVPANPRKSYDMHKIIERVFDQMQDGKKNYFELFPMFATNIITCFTRLNGLSVGVIANQPMSKAGSLDIDACDKASRFIRFCDAFNIPIITLVDVPGYLPGTDQEWGGIIRHGAKMLYAYSEAAAEVIYRKEIAEAQDKEKLLQDKIDEYRKEFANPYRAAEHLHVDDVIEPAETRSSLIQALETTKDKVEERPKKKHGIIPT